MAPAWRACRIGFAAWSDRCAAGAQGWANQLGDETTFSLTHERKWRHLWPYPRSGLTMDVTPQLGVGLGNVSSHLNGGVTLRVGEGLARDFGPPRIRSACPVTASSKLGGLAAYT